MGCWEADGAPGRASGAPPHCALGSTVQVLTDDGATIALHRHPAAGPPVILVHGVASNHHFWDLDPEHSLADWLMERGHDVWLLDLRGHGDAERDIRGQPQRNGWKVDHYGEHDVPAAVDYVKAATGYATVGYVGHSMGGMVGAIYAVTGGAPSLSSLIVVGSPGALLRGTPLYGLAQAAFWTGGATHLSFATPAFADLAAALESGPLRVKLQERLYNPANMESRTVERMFRSIVSPVSRGEMRHFARMMADACFESWDRRIDYTAALAEVKTPTYVVVGRGDHVATPSWVEAWGPAMGGPVEVFHAGTVSGLQADYGHLDLGLGERASVEIFPGIEAWLGRYPGEREGLSTP